MDNNSVLEELNEMIGKMEKACEIYRHNVKLAKELNVDLPIELSNRINALAALANICEKVYYYKTNKDDVLFEWLTLKAKPTVEDSMIVTRLLNQYLDLKREVGNVDYFIPDELRRK
jgi:hypothetical protein